MPNKFNMLSQPGSVRIRAVGVDQYAGLRGQAYIDARKLGRSPAPRRDVTPPQFNFLFNSGHVDILGDNNEDRRFCSIHRLPDLTTGEV